MFKRLFYTLNNNKQFARQVQVMNYLSSVHTSVSINELAQQIGCSIPTLRTDIHNLNIDLPNNIRIESLGKNGYILSVSEGCSIPTVIMNLAKKTDVFKIIDGIFHNEIYTFDTLSYNLFIAPNTLKKILTHINQELKSFNISISTSTIDLEGSETDIRIFFYAFYSDFNDLFVVEPDYSVRAQSYQEIMNAISHYHDDELHLNFFRTTMWLVIILRRISNRHYINHFDAIIHDASLDNYHQFKNTLIAIASHEFELDNIPELEIKWAYSILLSCISYSVPYPSNQAFQYHYIYRRACSDIHLTAVNNFLSLYYDQSTLNSPALESMRAYLINLFPLTALSPLLQKVSVATRNFTKESVNAYYLIWKENLKTDIAEQLFPIHFADDIAISLSMLHFSLLTQLRSHEIRILFTFQGEPGYDDFLIRSAQFMIPQNVHPIYVFHEPVTYELISQTKADLVVSNYDCPNQETFKTPTIRLSYIPSVAEWTHLRNVILDLSILSHEI